MMRVSGCNRVPEPPARVTPFMAGDATRRTVLVDVENVRRSISDWLCFMHLVPAGSKAELDRYIGYWKPYATSHAELDRETALQQEVANAARILADTVAASRQGKMPEIGEGLSEPRQK